MKQMFAAVLATLLFSISATAQDDHHQRTWKSHGDEITVTKSIPLPYALEKKETFGTKEILLEGIVSEVCQNKGCWMVVDSEGAQVRVEFKDYGFFVPWDSEGKKVRMQGTIREKAISAAAAKHMAGEMKKPPDTMDEIKEQQTITVFVASGVAIEGGSEISTEQQEIIEGMKQREGHEHHDH